ncbi:hypothetical protein RZS08_06055 [Arthrospira platensis SPKY1]|nr:hypothetical protein [Arthrospira platensis SPKY1]
MKELACPHCRSHGTLNNHGELKTKTGMIRGLRFWCSSRRKCRPGCGRSFCVWLGSVLPRHSVAAAQLAAFLAAWHQLGGNVLAAWQSARTGFSTDSAYRWVKRLLSNQGEVRTQLCRARAPPPTRRDGILADLFKHLSLVLESEAFIEAFQIRFQRPWPMGV